MSDRHMQQATFNGIADENFGNAQLGIWMRNGFIRCINPGQIDVCAPADQMGSIREFVKAGAPADKVDPNPPAPVPAPVPVPDAPPAKQRKTEAPPAAVADAPPTPAK